MSFDYAELRDVNEEVNSLPYIPHVTPLWKPINDKGGTCSNYASAKYVKLLERGWSLNDLRLACAYVMDVEPPDNYHAILLVRYEGSTYVMDNRAPMPRTFDFFPQYKWDKFQIAGTQLWEQA